MNSVRFWQTKVSYGDTHNVTRRCVTDELICGSHPRAHVKIPHPAPMVLFTIERIEKNGKILYHFETDHKEVEIQVWGKFQHLTELETTELPKVRYQSTLVEIGDISDERKPLTFEPEKWAAQSVRHETGVYALWHLCDGVLSESTLIRSGQTSAPLKSGYRVLWNDQDPMTLQLIEYDGVSRRIDMKAGRLGVPRAYVDNNLFIVTKVPDKTKIADINPELAPMQGDRFKKIVTAAGATWLLLMSLLQFMPKTPDAEPQLENLSPEIAKIILEAPKAVDGGDGVRGGGGEVTATHKDKRGGSGLESNLIKESSGPDEVVVREKGALAALTKAEKVVGSGVMKALEVTGKLATALSALDEGMKSGKIKAAGIPSFGATGGGKGSAKGVLGALGSIGGGGAAGGGIGIGGVGTQGFGGGGGGGKGGGFGTGVGAGLGKGEGMRNVAFDSDNINVRGGLERSEVEAVIQENLSQIRYCYNRGLRNNPGLNGKVTSDFTIAADGSVRISRIMASTLGTTEVEDCIKSRIASWKFPQPRGGGDVVVKYPFLFKAN